MQLDEETEVAVLAELERNMLEYGRTLQEQYVNDPRVEVSKALTEIWALLAYENPLKVPQVSHLLDRNGRVTVAEELNSAILRKSNKRTYQLLTILTNKQYLSANRLEQH